MVDCGCGGPILCPSGSHNTQFTRDSSGLMVTWRSPLRHNSKLFVKKRMPAEDGVSLLPDHKGRRCDSPKGPDRSSMQLLSLLLTLQAPLDSLANIA